MLCFDCVVLLLLLLVVVYCFLVVGYGWVMWLVLLEMVGLDGGYFGV